MTVDLNGDGEVTEVDLEQQEGGGEIDAWHAIPFAWVVVVDALKGLQVVLLFV